MTNQEINESVARKLGWKPHKEWAYANSLGIPSASLEWTKVPDYATNIADAWEIMNYVHKLKVPNSKPEDYWTVKINSRCGENSEKYWVVIKNFCFYDDKSNRYVDALADTAPLAICKAFLALKEKENQ